MKRAQTVITLKHETCTNCNYSQAWNVHKL